MIREEENFVLLRMKVLFRIIRKLIQAFVSDRNQRMFYSYQQQICVNKSMVNSPTVSHLNVISKRDLHSDCPDFIPEYKSALEELAVRLQVYIR